MTLQELYTAIGGDFAAAKNTLCIEKLIDKHIRKFGQNPVFASFKAAGERLDPAALFESAHAIKGLCANLGLVGLAALAEEICNEFRPGNPRKMTDGAVREKIDLFCKLYEKTCDGIAQYASSGV